jgi:hypothetical protein
MEKPKTKLEINRLYSRSKPIKRTVMKEDEEGEVEEIEETFVKDPKTGKLIKVKVKTKKEKEDES